MKTFTLQLQDATHTQRISDVSSFIGEDNSGSFGILADHARLMTSLIMGLSRFRVGGGKWQYLALPGGLLYFHNRLLTLSTRHYLLDDDYSRISAAMQQQLLAEEDQLHDMKARLHSMEEDVLRRIWRMSRSGVEM